MIESTVQGADPPCQPTAVDVRVLAGAPVEEIAAQFDPLPIRTGEAVLPLWPEVLPHSVGERA